MAEIYVPLKIHAAKTLQKSLKEFTLNMPVKIGTVFTYLPNLEKIKQKLLQPVNPEQCVCVLSTLDRSVDIRRTLEFEEMYRDGEYIYYYISEDKITFNLTTYSSEETTSEILLDELNMYFTNNFLLPEGGYSLENDIDYYKEYYSYAYFNPKHFSSLRLEILPYMLDSYVGDLFINEFAFNIYAKKMLVVRYPLVEEIAINGIESGSSLSIPLFGNSGSYAASGSGYEVYIDFNPISSS